MDELPVPPEAEIAKDASELFRGWIVNRRLECVLWPAAFEDHATWGVLLADAAHHIADALAEEQGADREQILRDIAGAFTQQMHESTRGHRGKFVDPEE
ncbi:MAG: DUF5076 domain-containing protein [Planctomycetes bacterium]|nr:DUF5076 domain-containing protein [Planctomycetota bacterium]